MTLALKTRAGGLTSALLALVALSALSFAPVATAAGDPVAGGTLRIDPAGALGHQLNRKHVHLMLGTLAIASGSIDPTSGAGSLHLRGSIVFKHGRERLRFRGLVATLGPSGGLLSSGHTDLLALRGGSVSRDGFGAVVDGVELRMPKRFARKLRKRFDLRSLRPGAAGKASVSEQPETVEIVGGTATVTPAQGSGSIDSKLAAHCVDPATDVSPLAPGVQPGGPGTTFFYPVSFGTISPTGAAGVIQQSGGIRITNGGAGLRSGCPSSSTVTIDLRDLSIDLQAKQVAAHVSVSGSGSPLGDLDAQIGLPVDVAATLVSVDPNALAIAANGTGIELDHLTASMLNTIFPQPDPVDPSMEIAAGDSFGTAGLSVQVR